MNASSLKTVLVLAVLAGVAYAVYVTLTRKPESTAIPGASEEWSRPPKVEIPGVKSTAPPFSSSPAATATGPGATPPGPLSLKTQTAGLGNSPASPGNSPAPSFVSGGLAAPASAASQGAGPAASMSRSVGPPAYPTQGAGSSVPSPGPGLSVATDRSPSDPFALAANTRLPAASVNTPAGPVSNMRFQDGPAAADGAQGSMPTAGQAQADVGRAFAAVMEAAMAKLDKGNLAEVHLTLSQWYGDRRLPPEQSRQLTELLGQLAGTVIYSRQQLLEPAYVVKPGDSLQQIARSYNVPWQLLAKINGIRDPGNLQADTELKVVRGPFNAVVDLDKYELILTLDGRYAGRFAIGIGRDRPPSDGRYLVRSKTANPAVYDANQQEDPSKPLGSRWIELDGGLGIHGTNNPQNIGRSEGRGSILLSDRDVEDLYDILTVGSNSSNGSTVTIRR